MLKLLMGFKGKKHTEESRARTSATLRLGYSTGKIIKQTGVRRSTWFSIACAVCGLKKEYSPKEHRRGRKYCSYKCLGASKGKERSCVDCKKRTSRAETKRCFECAVVYYRGELRGNAWKGGVSSLNKRFRESKEYKLWRTAVFQRDDYTCQECKQRGGKLNADHIKPFALFPDLRLKLENGRTLCEPCHRATPTYGFTNLYRNNLKTT